MLAEQLTGPLPNSAVIPLPAPRNTAAGRHTKITDRPLISEGLLTHYRRFAGAEARFSPADREVRLGRPLPDSGVQ
jgi:hypothetical protein